MDLDSYHHFGAYNFQVVPRFLEDLCTPDLDYLIQEEKLGF